MANTDIRTRRVSVQQLEVLWEFLNSHREIAMGYNRSLQAKERSSRKWADIAEVLNAQGHGAHKDGKAWSKYWVDFKAKMKKRNAAVRASMQRTGGGPSIEPPLSHIEEKFLQILGQDFGQGLACIQVDPFPEAATTVGTETPVSQSILLDAAVQQDLPYPLLDVSERLLVEDMPENRPEEGPVISPEHEPRQRRSRRTACISREEARHSLVQAAQERTEAARRSSAAMEGVQQSLAVIANGIQGIEQTLQEIKT